MVRIGSPLLDGSTAEPLNTPVTTGKGGTAKTNGVVVEAPIAWAQTYMLDAATKIGNNRNPTHFSQLLLFLVL